MVAASWPSGSAERLSAEECVALLRHLASEADNLPSLVVFERDDAASLGVGASDPAVVTYEPSTEPPYFVSYGSGDDETTLWFATFGGESEFGSSAAVPLAQAEEAVREFVAGKDPTAVSWTEV